MIYVCQLHTVTGMYRMRANQWKGVGWCGEVKQMSRYLLKVQQLNLILSDLHMKKNVMETFEYTLE